MTNNEHTFLTVDDTHIANGIKGARERLVFAAPGLGAATGRALIDAIARLGPAVSVILDLDADAYRIGYGDQAALEELSRFATERNIPLRGQPGLRIGVLVADETLLIWSPTPRSVEPERAAEQPNAVRFRGPAVETCSAAMGAGPSPTSDQAAEIGRDTLTEADLADTLSELKRNPPVPFDLARRTRVFSSRFQYVEFEIRGAQWAERSIRLSSLLLNADLPEPLRDLLDTRIRPFRESAEAAFEVPLIVGGVRAYDGRGERLLVLAKQSDVLKAWADIRDQYLKHLAGFGWLIRRQDLDEFRDAARAFEETLCAWVGAFKETMRDRDERLTETIVASVKERVERSQDREKLLGIDVEQIVRDGVQRLQVTEPEVRIVLKDVAWESSRDAEFQDALAKALPPEDLEGWFEEFTAARQRQDRQGPL